jgi:rfaE bifunctional protein nucleotidyltransferase chain/domain
MMQTLKEFIDSKSIRPDQLEEQVAFLKSSGLKIATLNGSFDILHAGHLEMLFQASRQADRLIVALNSDASIKAYKSKDRPYIPLEQRLAMMACISFVDFVTWFDETDPIRILSLIKPDVHVNGSEYGENCIEAETVHTNGGRIHIVELVPGLSTSKLIQKIREK